MPSSPPLTDRQFSADRQVWENLKQAIASSTGFTRWRLEKELDTPASPASLDEQVRAYLRETLETLAY